jgi:uncharacterized protein YjaG (DUF416 family)
MNKNYKTKHDLLKHFAENKVYIYDMVSVYLTVKEMGLNYDSFIELVRSFEIGYNELDELLEL